MAHRLAAWRILQTLLLAVLFCQLSSNQVSARRATSPKCPKTRNWVSHPAGQIPIPLRYTLCRLPDVTRKGYRLKVPVINKANGNPWVGWGTSLGEMGAFLGTIEKSARDCIAKLIFDKEDGLGMNIVRYNIPGGYNSAYSPLLAREPLNSKGYWPNPNKKFDPKGDHNQLAFLLEAKAYGVQYFEAIAYSPPWWMTVNKDVMGATTPGATNLNWNYVKDYAQYLATVLNFIEKNYGIQFDALVPFNEPMEGWWNRGMNLKSEGCNYNAAEINKLVPVVFEAVKGITRLAGPESWASSIIPATRRGKLSQKTLSMFSRLDVHGYRLKQETSEKGDVSQLTGLRKLAKSLNKPLWMTEWGPLGVEMGSDIDVALLMARRIIQHVNLLGAQAWLIWQAVHMVNNMWGMVRVRPGKPGKISTIYKTKQFYAFRHFTKFLQPGTIPMTIGIPDCSNTLFTMYDKKYPRLVVTVVNQRAQVHVLSIVFDGFKCLGGPCLVTAYRTSQTESMKLVFQDRNVNELKKAKIFGFSLTTFVVQGAYAF